MNIVFIVCDWFKDFNMVNILLKPRDELSKYSPLLIIGIFKIIISYELRYFYEIQYALYTLLFWKKIF